MQQAGHVEGERRGGQGAASLERVVKDGCMGHRSGVSGHGARAGRVYVQLQPHAQTLRYGHVSSCSTASLIYPPGSKLNYI